MRDDVKKALELARTDKVIGASLDAKVALYAEGELYEFASSVKDILPTVFMVSDFELKEGKGGDFKGDVENMSVTAVHAEGEKCARCWSFGTTVGSDADHPTVCARCAKVVKTIDFAD
jgi:isoleucyl-tRNA synthetase